LYLSPASNVDANTWFELSAAAEGSPTEKLYEKPIVISTLSDKSSANAVIYDENPSAGFVSIVAAPTTLTDVYVSTDATKQVNAYDTAAN